jgi:hypothetical protein
MNNTYQYILSKYNLKVGKDFFVEIPDMSRDDLGTLFKELNFNEGAEIGVERGLYSEVLCKANPKLHLWGIDPWSKDAYIPGISGVDQEQAGFEICYNEAVNRLKPYNVTLIRKYSMDALDDFEDESLDFIYIDANHDFVNFTRDIDGWKNKVKMGGIVAGHDYAYFSYKKFNHVKRVIESYTRCYRMRPYFVIGGMEYNGLKRDKYRSWMWVKT